MVCYGEILWDCLPEGKVLGGAQLNMAVQMHNMGLEPLLISAVGNDDLGRELLDHIVKTGVGTSRISICDFYPTSTVEVSLDNEGKATYEIVQPVAWDAITIEEDIFETVWREGIVFGTLSQRMGKQSKDSLDALLESSMLNFFDANFRLPFTTPDLIKEYLPQTTILKLNDEELPILANWLSMDYDEDENLSLIANAYGISQIILTKGSEGSKVFADNQMHIHKGHKVSVVDTVGCGDAYTAGYIFGLKNYMDIEGCMAWASALSAVVATQKGGCGKTSRSEVKKLISTKS